MFPFNFIWMNFPVNKNVSFGTVQVNSNQKNEDDCPMFLSPTLAHIIVKTGSGPH